MLRIEDTDPISLGKSIKKYYPHMPVILLAFDETEIKQLSQKFLQVPLIEFLFGLEMPQSFQR